MQKTVPRPSLPKREQEAVRLWIEISRCSGMLQRHMDGQLRKKHHQSMSRFDVLSQLERAEGKRLSTKVLAGQLLASSGNITRLLDRMINDGLLTRQANAQDRRSVDIAMTEKGLQCFYEMARDHAAWTTKALDDLSLARMRELKDLLQETRVSLETRGL